MVSASSSAWVGCSWVPSPALITVGPPVSVESLGELLGGARRGVPDDQRVGPAARSVSAVSRSDSPLDTDDPEALTLMTSALIHFPATSNDTRVRVDSSSIATTGAAAEGRQLLDLAAQQSRPRTVRVVEDGERFVAGQIGGR